MPQKDPPTFDLLLTVPRTQAIAFMRQIAELYGYEVKKK